LEAEVVVAGGGPAGICAAIAAAEEGADVILVERHGFVGGNASFLPSIMSFFTGQGKQVIRGIPQRLIDRLVEKGGCSGHVPRPGTERPTVTVVDNEMFKIESLSMLQEAGVRLVLHTLVVDAKKNGTALEAIWTESKSGRMPICGEIFVDATGDGDLAARAGAPYEKGRKSDGLMQPATLIFEVGGVELEAFVGYLQDNPSESYLPVSYYSEAPQFVFSGLSSLIQTAKDHGNWPSYKSEIIITSLLKASRVSINVVSIPYIDGTDAGSLTAAEIKARADIPNVVAFLREYVPGFGHAFLSQTAHQIGIRESRRITGEYVLSAADLAQGRQFPDVVAKSGYWMDVHDPDPLHRYPTMKPEEEDQYDSFLSSSYDIPYRSLIPLEVDNLLLSGRCISVSSRALGGIRVMAPCMATGQAAGTAAALCVMQRCIPRKLDVSLLQDSLASNGNAFLGL
jgi:hypothetical protein